MSRNNFKYIRILVYCLVLLTIKTRANAQIPDNPFLDSVSVNLSNSQVSVGWSQTNLDNVDGYVVKRKIFDFPGIISGTFNTVAILNTSTPMFYEDNSTIFGVANPSLRSESYRVVSYKIVENDTIYSNQMSEQHSTILLAQPVWDYCTLQNSLQWTAYDGWGSDIAMYQVFYYTNANPIPLIAGTVTFAENAFNHVVPSAGQKYYYFVVAKDNSGQKSSTSNLVSIETQEVASPDYINADFGTVLNETTCQLQFSAAGNLEYVEFKLLKSDSYLFGFDTIATITPEDDFFIVDEQFDVASLVYFYRLLALNECGQIIDSSNVAHNIRLSVELSPENFGHNILHWNNYKNWRGGIEQFEIFRSVDEGEFASIEVVTDNNLQYTDNVAGFVGQYINNELVKGNFCYYIEAVETDENPYGVSGKSRSNVVCALQDAKFAIPNAFNPYSTIEKNQIFKPLVTFVSAYNFVVYSKWGNVIFNTDNPQIGWDGKAGDGNVVAEGVYLYQLNFVNSHGKSINKSGHVSVLYH